MCFSATGSFAAAGLLAGIGAVAMRSIAAPTQRMFAAMPLLFAAQQVAEGIVWLTLADPARAPLQQVAVHAFLIFAVAVWPVWLPLSLRQAERSPARRQLLSGLACVGAGVATYALLALWRWPASAHTAGHSIQYALASGGAALDRDLYLAVYVIPTVLSFFVSGISLARVTGVALALSLAASVLIERDALTSVWCFFAALLSGLVLTAVILERRLGAAPAASAA